MEIEKWECNKCGSLCSVEIEFENTGYEYIDIQSKFRDRRCICTEQNPNWIKVESTSKDRQIESLKAENEAFNNFIEDQFCSCSDFADCGSHGSNCDYLRILKQIESKKAGE